MQRNNLKQQIYNSSNNHVSKLLLLLRFLQISLYLQNFDTAFQRGLDE